LQRLPFSFVDLPDEAWLWGACSHPASWSSGSSAQAMIFPPSHIAQRSPATVKTFLLAHHHPLKMLIMIMAARRRHMQRPSAELWVLIRDEFFW